MQEHAQQPDVARPVAGIELAESAMRLAVTLTTEPHGRRWQLHLPAPPAPDEAVDAIAGLIDRARGDAGEAPAASRESANAGGAGGGAGSGGGEGHSRPGPPPRAPRARGRGPA